jgi:hypothetical protein
MQINKQTVQPTALVNNLTTCVRVEVHRQPACRLLIDGMSDKPYATAALPLVEGPPLPIE